MDLPISPPQRANATAFQNSFRANEAVTYFLVSVLRKNPRPCLIGLFIHFRYRFRALSQLYLSVIAPQSGQAAVCFRVANLQARQAHSGLPSGIAGKVFSLGSGKRVSSFNLPAIKRVNVGRLREGKPSFRREARKLIDYIRVLCLHEMQPPPFMRIRNHQQFLVRFELVDFVGHHAN